METKTYILKQDYDAFDKAVHELQEGEFGKYLEKYVKFNQHYNLDRKPSINLCVYRKSDNELVGLLQIYGIDKEKKEIWLTASQVKNHTQDTISNTSIPIYSAIILHGGLGMFKDSELLGFIPDSIKAVIVTIAPDDENELLKLFRYTRLSACRAELVKPEPSFEVVTIEEDKFLVLEYEKEKGIQYGEEYLG